VRALQSAGAIGLPTSPHAHIRDNHRGHVSRRAWPGARVVDPRLLEASLIVTFTTIHWVGLRTGSAVTQLITLAVALLLLAVVGACLVATPVHGSAITPLPHTLTTLPWMSFATLFTAVTALRAILSAFDGWCSPTYMAEENIEPARTLPRALIGGTLLIAALYLLINIALVRVLPLPVLAHSVLAVADAARLVPPRGAAELVTVISLITMLSLLNSVMLAAPRILFSIGRDGLFTEKAALVSEGGTPRVALLLTNVVVVVLILICTFDQLLAMGAVLFLVTYVSTFLAVFVRRQREPTLSRPFKAVGYPFSTALVLIGSVAILIAAAAEDLRSARFAILFLGACIPCYLWARRRRMQVAVTDTRRVNPSACSTRSQTRIAGRISCYGIPLRNECLFNLKRSQLEPHRRHVVAHRLARPQSAGANKGTIDLNQSCPGSHDGRILRQSGAIGFEPDYESVPLQGVRCFDFLNKRLTLRFWSPLPRSLRVHPHRPELKSRSNRGNDWRRPAPDDTDTAVPLACCGIAGGWQSRDVSQGHGNGSAGRKGEPIRVYRGRRDRSS